MTIPTKELYGLCWGHFQLASSASVDVKSYKQIFFPYRSPFGPNCEFLLGFYCSIPIPNSQLTVDCVQSVDLAGRFHVRHDL